MRQVLLAASFAMLLGCAPQAQAPEGLRGAFEVQQIAEADLGAESWIDFTISDAGAIAGTTGCNPFTAQLTSFEGSLSIHTIAQQDAPCATEAQQTDETRFLTVLPAVSHFTRRGDRVVMYGRTPDQVLLLLRKKD